MSVCSSGKCPVIVAMDTLVSGGYIAPGRRQLIRRGIVGGGSGDDNGTIHAVSEAAFRAAVAKMELARDQMKGRQYKGDLMSLAGQRRILGICYLLSAREGVLADALRDLTGGDELTVDICGVYPSALCDVINGEIRKRGVGIAPLPAPTFDLLRLTDGNFAKPTGADDWEGLHAIADDLLEISKLGRDIEAYHLAAVDKIVQLSSVPQT